MLTHISPSVAGIEPDGQQRAQNWEKAQHKAKGNLNQALGSSPVRDEAEGAEGEEREGQEEPGRPTAEEAKGLGGPGKAARQKEQLGLGRVTEGD